jgi:translation initiation factor IF-1
MDAYLFSLLLGFVGLLVMAVSGVAGHGGDHSSHSHGGHLHGGHHHAGDVNVHGMGGHGVAHGHAGGHALGHGHAGGHGVAHGHGHDAGHAHHGHHHGDGHHGDAGKVMGSWFLSFLSPRVLFSVLIGIGAAGLLLGGVLGGPLLAAVAIVAGFAFELAAVRPVWNFFFRFGSQPALTLESAVTDTAEAVTGFNPQGEGLVKIELDGQIVQVLGRLSPADRATGVRVRAGDSLVVEEVDAVRNRCVVSLPVSAGQIRGA